MIIVIIVLFFRAFVNFFGYFSQNFRKTKNLFKTQKRAASPKGCSPLMIHKNEVLSHTQP